MSIFKHTYDFLMVKTSFYPVAIMEFVTKDLKSLFGAKKLLIS